MASQSDNIPRAEGANLEGGCFIEPVHNKGGYRLSPLPGC
jgi:hypothetical protein